MTFPLPQFPLFASVWDPAALPTTNPPSAIGLACQLYVDPHADMIFIPVAPYSSSILATTWIKFPGELHTMLRGGIIRCPEALGYYYKIMYKEFFYLGFPQSYLGVLVVQCDANGTVPRTY
jgi:hypothetical protein